MPTRHNRPPTRSLYRRIAAVLCCGLLAAGLGSTAQTPAIDVTQVVAFAPGVEVYWDNVAPYGESIVAHDADARRLAVYDLMGALRFDVDYARDLPECCRPRVTFVFVDARELKSPSRAEVVFAFRMQDGETYVRAFDDTGALLLSVNYPSRQLAKDPYLYVDGVSGAGFAAISIETVDYDSTHVYRFADYAIGLRVAGEVDDDYPVFEGVPLVVNQRDTLAIGYSVGLEEVTRLTHTFGARFFSLLPIDLRHDGRLDAVARSTDTVDGVAVTRIVVYDASGYRYLDTLLAGEIFGFSIYAILGLRAPRGGYFYLELAGQGDDLSFEFAFRSDSGTLVEIGDTGPLFTQNVCFLGVPYLMSAVPGWFVVATLYSAVDASAQVALPPQITYDGERAALHAVIGTCDAGTVTSLSLTYDQATRQRLLFTDADTVVHAELPYYNFAYAIRVGGKVHAYCDRAADGTPAVAIYHIGEVITSVKPAPEVSAVLLAPNPASEYFTLHGCEAEAVMQVDLYDASGRLVGRHTDITAGERLPVPAAAGVYVAQVTEVGTGRTTARRLVVR